MTILQTLFEAKVRDYVLNWITSKTNIWAAALAGVIITFVNTKFGLNLGVTETTAVTTVLVAVMAVGVNILRTFFNTPKVISGKKVTPVSVK